MKRNLRESKKEKISLDSTLRKGSRCEQYPAFSFRYLTTNRRYNFEYFQDNKNEESKMHSLLVKRLKEISEKPYSYWSGLGKVHGSEQIPYWRFRIAPNGLALSKDDKLVVFRFCQQNYRIIGIRLESCPTLFIIGFDFDYSAYEHGN